MRRSFVSHSFGNTGIDNMEDLVIFLLIRVKEKLITHWLNGGNKSIISEKMNQSGGNR